MISRRAQLTLRLAATGAMLVWLAGHVDLSGLKPPVWSTTTAAWLATAGAVTFLGIVLSALRWQRVLHALDLSAGLPTLVHHHLAGLFVGNFLPTTIGGDVLRASRLSATNGAAPATVASVVLERLTGWLVLPVLTLVALTVNPNLRRVAPEASGTALAVASVTLSLLVALLVLAGNRAVGHRLAATDGWRRFTGALHLGIERVRRRPHLAFEILTVGFAYQLTVMLAAFLTAKALGLTIGWTAILAIFPAVAIVQVLPLTVGGLGTREAALVFFLHPLGVAQADAFALGLLLYALNLAVSLLGAPSFAVGRRPARVTA